MLSNLGIRTKLLAVLCVPMALLLVVSAILVGDAEKAASSADRIQQLTATSTDLVSFVHELQLERGASLRYLATKSQTALQLVQARRTQTDESLKTLNLTIASSPLRQVSDTVSSASAAAQKQATGLAEERGQVDNGKADEEQVSYFYGIAVSDYLNLLDRLSDQITAPSLTAALRNYLTLASALEYSAQERDLITLGALQGKLSIDQHNTLVAVAAQQDNLMDQLQKQLPKSENDDLVNGLGGASAVYSTDRNTVIAANAGAKVAFSADAWEKAANDRFTALTGVERTLGDEVGSVAGDIGSAAQHRALTVGVLTLLALLAVLALVLVLSRRLTAPLRKLTEAAEELRVALPTMVEQMQTPGEAAKLTVEPIAVSGRDEIGRLAEAFNSVNDVTVSVAIEQAALRGSIAEMFVNVARRNQGLLARQLHFLDQLEAQEENADTLDELFKVDHLAARMRRNAESLLVLAGIDGTRRLRQPMPLSDVLRTSIGEVENYDRVDLSLGVDPRVSGRNALALSHLIAELIDNATQFSSPETRVAVSTITDDDGVVAVLIRDEGLGMNEDELAAAKARLEDAPQSEIAVAQRLGLHVAGRLARRLGALIGLTSRPGSGTTAKVALPASLLEGTAEAPSTRPAKRPAVQAPAGRPEPVAEQPAVQSAPPVRGPVADPAPGQHPAPVAEAPGTGDLAEAWRALPARARSIRDSSGPQPMAGTPLLPAELADLGGDSVWQPTFSPDSELSASSRAAEQAAPAPAPAPAAGAGGRLFRRRKNAGTPEPSADPVAETAAPAQPMAERPAPVTAAAAESLPVANGPTADTLSQLVLALAGPEEVGHYTPEAENLVPLATASQDILPTRGRPARGRGKQRRKSRPGEPPVAAAAPVATRPAAAAAEAQDTVAEQGQGPQPAPTYGDDLAFNALAELSQLSGAYQPAYEPAGGLTKRKPVKVAARTAPPVEPRKPVERNADQVRGRLSGFRAGVERGRTHDNPVSAGPGREPVESVPRKEGQ